MGKFALIATTAAVLTISTAPVSAEHNAGPLRNGDKCWHVSPGHAQHGWGYWGECTVAALAARDQRRLYRRHRDPHNDR
jgi:hypothetical protein